MHYKTLISRFAETDIIEIVEFYYEMNPIYAKKILNRIEERINDLKNFPERGRIVPELEKQNIIEYRELIEEYYRIIYSIQDKTVIIHSVIDGRRNLDELLMKKILHLY